MKHIRKLVSIEEVLSAMHDLFYKAKKRIEMLAKSFMTTKWQY